VKQGERGGQRGVGVLSGDSAACARGEGGGEYDRAGASRRVCQVPRPSNRRSEGPPPIIGPRRQSSENVEPRCPWEDRSLSLSFSPGRNQPLSITVERQVVLATMSVFFTTLSRRVPRAVIRAGFVPCGFGSRGRSPSEAASGLVRNGERGVVIRRARLRCQRSSVAGWSTTRPWSARLNGRESPRRKGCGIETSAPVGNNGNPAQP
jgi:hypothetical protein